MSALRPKLIVNAGGNSRRMGTPKALLPVPPHSVPLVLHIMRRLAPVTAEHPVLVVNSGAMVESIGLALAEGAEPPPVTFVQDRNADEGTLGGIISGLQAVEGWALIVACDQPLVSARLIAQLASLAQEQDDRADRWDVIMPVVGGYEEPLHALYHTRCIPTIDRYLAAGQRRVISFLRDVRVRTVHEEELRRFDPDLRSFVNANTPEEWQHALELLALE